MKKIILILLLLVSSYSFSQQRRDKIKSLKIAFITEKLELTEAEAQKFWPVYNAHEAENAKLRKESANKRKNIDKSTLTNQEAEALLEDMLKISEQKHQRHKDYVKELKTVLPAKKIIQLFGAEKQFKTKMIKEFSGRHKRRGKQKP